MKSWLKHPLPVTARLLWLAGELLLSALNYVRHCSFGPAGSQAMARASWLQHSSRRVLRVFNMESQVIGAIPSSGLLVCNHLSYLDILTLASLAPCVFVAKHDVKHWPVLGWFAGIAGTIFVHREKRLQAGRNAREIEIALRNSLLVVLFPEGTSSGGDTVLPFKSSLLEPAVPQAHTLTAGCISYELDDGDVSEEVCYWKDMTLVPHLLNLLSKRTVRVSVYFHQVRNGHSDRKQLARQLHAEVLRLKLALRFEIPENLPKVRDVANVPCYSPEHSSDKPERNAECRGWPAES
jgi:1-acyl-sn-glycerol-3-phosphate acyltransferase